MSNDVGSPSMGAPRSVAGSPPEDAGQKAPEYCTAVLTLLKVCAPLIDLCSLALRLIRLYILTHECLCLSCRLKLAVKELLCTLHLRD